MFKSALAAVHGRACVVRALAARSVDGPIELIALGKAAQAMTEGAIDALGAAVSGGLVVSKKGHLDAPWLAVHGLTAMTGGHPLPSAASLAAGQSLCARLAGSEAISRLFLISGGTSSLVEQPVAGLGLAELERANDWLLSSGLPIGAVNLVRKSLSRIKGGGLLRWLELGRTEALAISDVPGDDVAVIGSGLLVAEPALAERVAQLELPEWLRDWVARGLAERGALPTGTAPTRVIASLDNARRAAVAEALARGLAAHEHRELLAGEAAICGAELGRRLRDGPRGIHIWGGETTVRLPESPGRGGRNQHLALAAARVIAGRSDCALLSVGTDGTDGPTDVAGALVDGGTLARAAERGFDAADALRRADAGSLLEASGDLVRTGATGTNVMDLVIGLKG